ncbi:uncharacterized protein V6R79_011549 [Siganus canaliculatus]
MSHDHAPSSPSSSSSSSPSSSAADDVNPGRVKVHSWSQTGSGEEEEFGLFAVDVISPAPSPDLKATAPPPDDDIS